ncbi:YihY/virulence factor BrkB family protein [Nocardioides daejeonensis]|uniref:YihY/virulence factor BrkB family protein n=1 Tax=Nocardioides daejeonensis TaxID=1046556 RepID=UPI0013A5B2C8|nr:YihY/virulence factor BrkB family protein [Nocardioides daejeonensis]
MAGLADRMKARVADARRRRPWLDHALRTQEHYSSVDGNLLSGAMTYFAFLSFFPVLALAFFVVGILARVVPDIQDTMTEAIGQVLPGLVGEGSNQISLDEISSSANTVGVIGLVGVAYAGLGWLSAMRQALLAMFEEPTHEQPGFVLGKLRDLASLGLIGAVMVLSIGLSSGLVRMSDTVLDWLGLGVGLGPLVWAFGVGVGMLAGTLLFFTLFLLLARPNVPRRSLWSGALLGAIFFEVLKQLSALLIDSTKSQPAFQAFGIALILLVWIYYFSRVVMYAAAWAHTSSAAIAVRAALAAEAREDVPLGPAVGPLTTRPEHAGYPPAVLVGAGSVLGVLLARLVRRRDRA